MVFAFLGLSTQLIGQTKVTGKILEGDTGSPLPGATVVVEGTTNGTLTKMNGTFNLDVSAGDLTLSITYVGFLKEQVKLTISSGEVKTLETITLKPDVIGMEELLVVASYAKDRETPVSVSTIKPEMIMEKLGTQEFPEILKSTPSVYATKEGGGYGDGRINLRGFDSNNIGVLINGVPVNDMENGKVYWSNWAGLSDVTRTMQVQRGLGASKLAISSIGGTINIITKSTDAQKGGSVYYAVGNDGYNKQGFTVSTGMFDNGWAVTASGSRTRGDGYARGTSFEGWSYFFNVAKKLSKNQQISFTAFGAPQWHNQRSGQHLVQAYRDHPDGIKLNSNFGYRNGKEYGSDHAFNKYHKPQLSLNHTLAINRKTKLHTAVYASISKGGGRRVDGPQDDLLEMNYPNATPKEATLLTPEGYIDFDSAMVINQNSMTGSQAVMSMSTNAHDWYGILSSINSEIGDIKLTGGLDGRYYRGYHYTEITDLLGGEYYLDNANINRDASTPLFVGDKISYYNLTDVLWEGVFLQAEYVKDKMSGFISAAGSNTSYKRTDKFKYLPENQSTEWVNFIGYSAKAGFNYNLTDAHNVFVNGGYFIRAPFANSVFMNYTNTINEEAKPQRVLSTELGYGYRSGNLRADLTLYRTEWLDKTITRSLGGQETANITGLNALHQGVEAEVTYHPFDKVDIRLMGSMGDWTWQDDVEAAMFDENQVFTDSLKIYAKDIHVGDAAQTTAAVGIDYKILPKVKIGLDYNYYDRLFAEYDIEGRTKEELIGADAWQLPDYHLLDMNIKYQFKIGNLNATLYGKVNNLLDTEYIADATDQTKFIGNEIQYGDETNSPVYFGFGRTWSIALKFKF